MMSWTIARSRTVKALRCFLPGFCMWCASSMVIVRKEWLKRVDLRDPMAVGKSQEWLSLVFFLDNESLNSFL